MDEHKEILPGCEKYTKAYEISSLQKYLKKGIKKRDDNLSLETEPTPGPGDPRFPKALELSDKKELLTDNREIVQLESRKLNVVVPERETTLENRKESITDNREVSLEEHKEIIQDQEIPTELVGSHKEILEGTNKDISLENHKETIQDQEIPTELVGNHKEILEGTNKDISLEDYKETIQNKGISQDLIGSHKEILEGTNKNISLEDYKEKLSGMTKPVLEEHVERITNERSNISLEDHKENIHDSRVPELEDYKKTLEVSQNPKLPEDIKSIPGEPGDVSSLEDKKISLSGENKEVNLEDEKLQIPGYKGVLGYLEHESLEDTKITTPGKQKDVSSLEDHIEGITDPRTVTLEDHKETIQGKENPGLEDHIEKISDGRGAFLEEKVVGLEDKSQVFLEDHRENLEDTRTVTLEDHKENLEDPRDVSLENHRENLEDKRTPELSKKKINIEDSRVPSLEDHKDTIEAPKDPPLETKTINLKDKRQPTLEDHQEKLKGALTEQGLSEKKITIEAPKTPKLSEKKLVLEDKRNTELSEKIVPGPKNVETPLSTEKITISPEGTPELSDEVSKVPGELKEQELPKNTIRIPGEIIEDSLSEKIVKIKSENPPELSEDVVKVPGEIPNIELSGQTKTINGDSEWGENLEDTVIPLTIQDSEPYLENIIVLAEPSHSEPGWNGDLENKTILSPENQNQEVEGVEDTVIPGEPNRNPEGWNEELEDTIIPGKEDQNPVGWDESLEDTVIPGEPDENPVGWSEGLEDTVIPGEEDQNPEGWDENLEDTVIPGEPDENPVGWDEELEDTVIPGESDENPEGWDEELEDTVIPGESDQNPVGWDESLEDTIIPGESDENPVGWDESLEDTVIPGESDQNPEGWDENLEDTVIPGEPDENPEGWDESLEDTIIPGEPDQNPEGWDESLEDEVIPGESDENPVGWNESLDDTLLSGEPDLNPEGWGGELVTKGDIKTEGKNNDHDNWTRGQHQDAEVLGDPGRPQDYIDREKDADLKKYGGITESEIHKLTNINEILGLVTKEDIKTEGENNDHDNWTRGQHQDAEVLGDPGRPQDYIDREKDADLQKYGGITEEEKEKIPEHTNTEIPGDPGREQDYINREKDSDLSKYGGITESEKEKVPEHIDAKILGNPGRPQDYINREKSSDLSRYGEYSEDEFEAIPAYKLAGSFTSYLNPSKYLRWIVQNTVGFIPLKGSLKQMLLDEALIALINARDLLERSLDIEPYRLPGSNEYALKLVRKAMSGVDLGDAVDLVMGAAANLLSSEAIIIKNPINRPDWDKKGGRPKPQEVFETKDGRGGSDFITKTEQAKNETKGFLKKAAEVVTKALGSNQGLLDYRPSYFNVKPSENLSEASGSGHNKETGVGLYGTLSNLCPFVPKEITSFDQLKELMDLSPYMTNSNRLYGFRKGDVHRHDNVMTLDSNHIWEIIFEPYIGIENGNRSYLPSIQQINYENYYNFGICTNWDSWIPFTSFELNTKKMIQKNINLYSGEISIPQNLEFTNELRLVICDDQYKSWKRYFDYVMYASIYNTYEVNYSSYYAEHKCLMNMGTWTNNTFDKNDLIMFQKGIIRPAPYKNLTFRCKILSMNPQYQTINVSDLLVVLKDFTEEWQGEIDSSPTELALMFSVVGENPAGEGKMTIERKAFEDTDNQVKKINRGLKDLSSHGTTIDTA